MRLLTLWYLAAVMLLSAMAVASCASLLDCSYDYDQSGEKHLSCSYRDRSSNQEDEPVDGVTIDGDKFEMPGKDQ